MSALLISSSGEVISYWQGETPASGDIIFIEEKDRMLLVGGVIRTVGMHPSESGPIAYPTSVIKIMVEDYDEDPTLPKMLKKLKAQGF